LEDLKAQTVAQKAALASLKASLENSKMLEMEVLNETNVKKMEMLKYEMEQKYYNDLDNLKNENEMEILAVRIELDKAVDLNKQRERENELRLDEFQSEMRHKQKQIDKFVNEIRELKASNGTLKEELEAKSRELKQIRSDTLNEIK
jgi:chromosome segregation ATPase